MTDKRVLKTALSAEASPEHVQAAHPFDHAVWLGQLPEPEASQHLATLDLTRRAKVFAHLTLERQVELARAIGPHDFAQIVAQMDA